MWILFSIEWVFWLMMSLRCLYKFPLTYKSPSAKVLCNIIIIKSPNWDWICVKSWSFCESNSFVWLKLVLNSCRCQCVCRLFPARKWFNCTKCSLCSGRNLLQRLECIPFWFTADCPGKHGLIGVNSSCLSRRLQPPGWASEELNSSACIFTSVWLIFTSLK